MQFVECTDSTNCAKCPNAVGTCTECNAGWTLTSTGTCARKYPCAVSYIIVLMENG